MCTERTFVNKKSGPANSRPVLHDPAYHAGEVSALVPINFIQLPVVVICAYFLFDQKLDAATAIGAVIIVGANVYIARREARFARELGNAATHASQA